MVRSSHNLILLRRLTSLPLLTLRSLVPQTLAAALPELHLSVPDRIEEQRPVIPHTNSNRIKLLDAAEQDTRLEEGIAARTGVRQAGIPGLEADQARTVFLSALGALMALGAAVSRAHKRVVQHGVKAVAAVVVDLADKKIAPGGFEGGDGTKRPRARHRGCI